MTSEQIIVFLILFFGVLLFLLAWRTLKSKAWKKMRLQKSAKLAAEGDVAGMKKILRRNMNSKDVSDLLTNALIYYHIRAGEFEDAEKIVSDAVRLGDKSGMAIAQLGYIAGGRGNDELAEEYYRKAAKTDNRLTGTMNINIAAIYIQNSKKLDEAEELLKNALDMREEAGRTGIHLNLAMLYLKKRDFIQARVQALIAYESIPQGSMVLNINRANALGIAARACVEQGETDEGGRLAGKALKIIEDIPGEAMLKLKEELNHLIPDKHTSFRTE